MVKLFRSLTAGTLTKLRNMYQATIQSTEINNGRLKVGVIFQSENDSFEDTFETNQYQNDSWIGEQIERRLSHLNSLTFLKENIPIGPYHKAIKEKTGKDIFYEKAAQYTRFMDTARMGVIRHDRPIIVELRKWLEDNFKDEYID